MGTRPTRADLAACVGRTVPDVLPDGGGLRVLFCGINPGLYTAWTGHHFARPGNRFWPSLHRSGFTPRLLAPEEEGLLPALGLGITNVVARATATAAELTRAELVAGGRRLEGLVTEHQPRALVVLGVTAYRAAFDRPRAQLGAQPEPLAGVPVWALPNPSGLNAHHTVDSIAAMLSGVRRSVDGLA